MFQTGIVGIPSDDGNPEVAGQLQKVLRRGRRAAEELRVGQVQDRGDVLSQEVLAQIVQNVYGEKNAEKNFT